MATLFNTKIKDTYQSLFKLEDNSILTSTIKNLTDGLGNASLLYMSTSVVRIGSNSSTAMYWDDTNSRLGIGIAAPAIGQLSVGDSSFVVGASLGYNTTYGGTIDGSLQLIASGNNTQLWIRPSGNTGAFNGNYWARIEHTASLTTLFGGNYGDVAFGVGSTERMRITNGGNVGIGTTSPTVSSLLEVTSTSKGFLPPRMSTAQKLAIATPAAGLMVYDTDLARPCFHNGATWITL